MHPVKHTFFVILTVLFCAINGAALAHDNGGEDHDHNRVTITEKGNFRFISSNGIPDHKPGAFPNRGNPNRISEQMYKFRVTLEPKKREASVEAGRMLFGVAVNGVVLDPGTAEFYRNDRRSGWRYQAMSGKIDLGLDDHHAHVQPTGAYHYHGIPTGLVQSLIKEKKLDKESQQMILLGYAADGFPIYNVYAHQDANDVDSGLHKLKSSYRLKKGERDGGPGGSYDGTFEEDFEYEKDLGDLDECNGREGVTPEYPDGTYYYVLTEDYPFIPRRFKGQPDESFIKGPPGGPNGPRRGPQNGRPFGPPRDGNRPPPPRGGDGPPPRGDRPPPPRG